MTFTLSGMMLDAMWVVLGFMALNFLVGLYRSLRGYTYLSAAILGYLQDMLHYVLPLFLLANIMSLDPTGWLVLIAYYVGALGIVLKYVSDIKHNLTR